MNARARTIPTGSARNIAPPGPAEMSAIARIAHEAAGIVIAQDKTSMIQSRLSKRLVELGMTNYASYLQFVRSDRGTAEKRLMISSLTTNVSHFFRELHHFDLLREKILPPLFARMRAGAKVRIWSAGCSNGQEAYSIAMTVLDMAPDAHDRDFRILATDIDPVVVAKGRSGTYDLATLAPVDAAQRGKYVTTLSNGEMQLIQPVRDMVSFRELNLHAPWPMRGPFDVIFCRNVVIYFDPPTQTRLWARYAEALAPQGYLFVGHSERVPSGPGTPFETAGITSYRKTGEH